MRILLIHNSYNHYSGEEAVVDAQIALLKAGGHDVQTYMRGSSELKGLRFGHAHGFLSGVYNRRAVREIREIIGGQKSEVRSQKPGVVTNGTADCRLPTADSFPIDIVHIHNLYPLISPAILPVIKSTRQLKNKPTYDIPKTQDPIHTHPASSIQHPASNHQITNSPPKIVMTVHNYRLICPNGLFFTHDEICEQCSGGKEWKCITRNCECSLFKSTGYALRNFWARRKRYYLDNVDAFLCLTEFQKNKLVENGFPAEKCFVLPNFLKASAKEHQGLKQGFALFSGRINAQKGFDILAKAAAKLPGIPFRVAGKGSSDYITKVTIPTNIEMAGKLPKEEMEEAFTQASFLVFTSRSYEGFPMVFLEAMAAGIPVIAPRMAGYPEIIEDGVNGLLFNPGDAEDLAKKIEMLWNDPELRARLGENGRKRLETHYSPEVYYKKLIAVYKVAGLSSPQ
ncbi:MAG: glycosyltransferase family 4 protein [Bacteroidetes bacterium]|nr:glycosyltransferase family 4 protein [Bacteroidota bacterium]